MPKSSVQATMLGINGVPIFFFSESVVPPVDPTPELPSLTKVFGWYYTPSGNVLPRVQFKFTTTEQIEGGDIIVPKGQSSSVISDEEGYFEINLYAGNYTLVVDCEVEHCVSVPSNVSEINLQELT